MGPTVCLWHKLFPAAATRQAGDLAVPQPLGCQCMRWGPGEDLAQRSV